MRSTGTLPDTVGGRFKLVRLRAPGQHWGMDNVISGVIPELAVAHVLESVVYFRDVLGFRVDQPYQENGYALVSRDRAAFRLVLKADVFAPVTLVVTVANADALIAEWTERGARVESPVADKLEDARELVVREPNGHRFRILQATSRVERGSFVARDDVRVVKRLPSTSEFQHMVEAVRWAKFVNHEATARSLSRTLFSVVAEHDGRCVGLARVIGDGALYFQVADVAVLLEYQGGGVGSRMMEQVVAFLRATAQSNAFVGLNADGERASFFERQGFRVGPGGTGGMIFQG